jgi:hypothetical protein
MSTRNRKRMILFPLVLILLAATATLAPSASAAGTVVGTISPSSVPAGASQATSFTIAPTSGQLGSFNLTAPTGWALSSLSSTTGVSLVSSTQIQGRNLSVSSSAPLTITFSALAPCSPSSGTWSLVAKSNGGFNGPSLGIDPTSVLSSTLTGTCTAAFVTGRGPADAAFNGGTKSENITSEPYTPDGLQMQALVSAANGDSRPGISVSLQLSSSNSATLSGPTSATSGTDGVATFLGTVANPIAIDKTGLNYTLTPGATGVVGTASTGFGVYQEGEACISGQSCVVHGKSADNHLDATVTSSDNGTLAVTVQEFALDCGGAPALSPQVIIWKKTGTGSQTVDAFIDKFLVRKVLDRGSSHIEVCFQTDNGKTFTDKFGNQNVTQGFLPDCGPGITTNCIVSETGVNGGGRIIEFTVEDGKGRI